MEKGRRIKRCETREGKETEINKEKLSKVKEEKKRKEGVGMEGAETKEEKNWEGNKREEG